MGARTTMACLAPGESIEATGLVMPVRLDEAMLALEDIVPRLIRDRGADGPRPVAAIVDRFESCGCEELESATVPGIDTPIMGLAGGEGTDAWLDTWVAKGTVVSDDGEYAVFVAFLDVMRRVGQGSWTAQSVTLLGTRQSVASLISELEVEAAYA